LIKNLVKHGNNWAVIIDRPILRFAEAGSRIPGRTDDWRHPHSDLAGAAGRSWQQRSKCSGKVNARHARAFRKLAE